MVCPGYVFFENLLEKEAGEPAKQGTAAGEYLERLLLDKPVGQVASNGVYFDDDMKFYLTPMAKEIKENAASEILCETRIDWQTASGITIRGQYDACYVDHQGRLCIDDLKYGWGIVEVEENWQLLGYAIGEVIRRGQGFNEIVLRIRQPRPHHEDGDTREWIISYADLIDYKEKIEERMMQITSGTRTLQTSDNCKYCEAAAEACPAFNRLFYRALEVSTEFTQDSITDDELSRQLDQVQRAEEAIRIKKDSLIDLGVSRIKEGKLIPNYIQEKKYGHRKWKNGISPKAIQMMTGVDVTETKVMSPAKAEKAGVDKKLVKQLAEASFAGFKLVKKDTSELGNKVFGTHDPNGGN